MRLLAWSLASLASGSLLAAGDCLDAAGRTLLLEERGSTRIEAVAAEAVSVGSDGLSWQAAAGSPPRLLRWERLRSVAVLGGAGRAEAIESACPAFAASIAPQRSTGDRLWRGLSRLERSDFTAALEILEPLAAETAAERSTRSALAAVALLHARLHSASDPALVAEAALGVVALDRAAVAVAMEAVPSEHRVWFDPIWPLREGWPIAAPPLPCSDPVPPDRVARLERAAPEGEGELVAALLVLLSPSMPQGPTKEPTAIPPSWQRLLEIRRSGPERIREYRERWLADASEAERAAIHAHLGARLLAESDPALRRRGVLEWLAIAAASAEVESWPRRWVWPRIAEAAEAEGLHTLAEHARQRAASVAGDSAPPAHRRPWSPR